jgi:hypothetical protein
LRTLIGWVTLPFPSLSLFYHLSLSSVVHNEVTPDTVKAIFNFAPGNDPELGEFIIKNSAKNVDSELDEEDDDYDYPEEHGIEVNMLLEHDKYYIFLYAYRILVGRFPELKPSVIYTMFAQGNWMDTEESQIAEQYVWWLNVADYSDMELPSDHRFRENSFAPMEYFWLKLLAQLQDGQTEEAILREAWLGKGKLYHFVRADQ